MPTPQQQTPAQQQPVPGPDGPQGDNGAQRARGPPPASVLALLLELERGAAARLGLDELPPPRPAGQPQQPAARGALGPAPAPPREALLCWLEAGGAEAAGGAGAGQGFKTLKP